MVWSGRYSMDTVEFQATTFHTALLTMLNENIQMHINGYWMVMTSRANLNVR
jgi:hypothetical protein